LVKQCKGGSVRSPVIFTQIIHFPGKIASPRFRGGQRIQDLHRKTAFYQCGGHTGQTIRNGPFGCEIKISDRRLDEKYVRHIIGNEYCRLKVEYLRNSVNFKKTEYSHLLNIQFSTSMDSQKVINSIFVHRNQ